MLARMLEANDYNVGLYTSPHVQHLHERITVNSEMINDAEMRGLLNRVYAPVEKLSKTDPPTFFEIMTAMAFMHFVDKSVDIAVIETGLGGNGVLSIGQDREGHPRRGEPAFPRRQHDGREGNEEAGQPPGEERPGHGPAEGASSSPLWQQHPGQRRRAEGEEEDAA